MFVQNLRHFQRFILRRPFNVNWKSASEVVRGRVTNFQVPIKPYIFLYSFLALPFQKQAEAQSTTNDKVAAEKLSEVVQHADQLYDEDNVEELVKLLKSFPDPEQYEIKWRLARALFALSKTADAKTKKELVNEAFVRIQEALALKEDHFAGHKWMAILLDKKSGLDGIKERIGQLENVKRHMERAVELNPQDPTSWYILGEFALGLAEINWVTLKIVNTLFATPPRGTYEEALTYFKKAEDTEPDFYSMNYLMLGKCYLGLNNKEMAREWLTKASEVTVKNEDDKNCKQEALKLLKRL